MPRSWQWLAMAVRRLSPLAPTTRRPGGWQALHHAAFPGWYPPASPQRRVAASRACAESDSRQLSRILTASKNGCPSMLFHQPLVAGSNSMDSCAGSALVADHMQAGNAEIADRWWRFRSSTAGLTASARMLDTPSSGRHTPRCALIGRRIRRASRPGLVNALINVRSCQRTSTSDEAPRGSGPAVLTSTPICAHGRPRT